MNGTEMTQSNSHFYPKKKRKKETVFSTFENCKIPKHAEHDKLD